MTTKEILEIVRNYILTLLERADPLSALALNLVLSKVENELLEIEFEFNRFIEQGRKHILGKSVKYVYYSLPEEKEQSVYIGKSVKII